MIIDTSCKTCGKKYNIDTNGRVGFKFDFCSESCNEEYYAEYWCGFVPRKYLDMPKKDLSMQIIKTLEDRW